MSWIEKIDKFDAVWQLKRPANFQHLLPYQAVIRWSEDGITIVTILVCGILSSFFLFLTAYFLEVCESVVEKDRRTAESVECSYHGKPTD